MFREDYGSGVCRARDAVQRPNQAARLAVPDGQPVPLGQHDDRRRNRSASVLLRSVLFPAVPELHVGEPMMSGGRYSTAREEKVVIVAQIATTRPHSSQQQQPERPLVVVLPPCLGRVLSLSLCSNI
uniref:(northern house mosquito) hypothetical protein n=1 Tax=Culex pipiens TaxID=7175 RepID=A0A8D8K060_CULPI